MLGRRPSTSNLSAWYSIAGPVESPGTIFQDALHAFSSELSNDPEKLQWIVESKPTDVAAVLAAVKDAQTQYDGRKRDSKTKDALVSLAERMHHYSNIMDVVVSHHPEYTALVWGAMRFFFVGVVNHQKIITRLSEGLVQIANLLPTTELTSRLYPVPRVRSLVVAIYVNILKFLVRALRWYQESKFMHMVHAITRPTELSYDDILQTISSLARSLSDAAMVSSQAEQRDMHLEILRQIQGQECLQRSLDSQDALIRQVGMAVLGACGHQQDLAAELRSLIIQGQDAMREHISTVLFEALSLKTRARAMHDSAQIDMRQQLSAAQVAEALEVIAVTQLSDPAAAHQTSLLLANKRRVRPSLRGPPFWLEDKFQQWNRTGKPSLVIIDGIRKMRFHLQWFSAKSIALLREAGIPAVWVLKTVGRDSSDAMSSVDIIKYLIRQVVLLNKHMHTDSSMSQCSSSFSRARSEEDWIDILGLVLQGLPCLYIVLDFEILSQAGRSHGNAGWPAVFSGLFERLSERNVKTVVKVALVSYSSPLLKDSLNDDYGDCVVTVGRARQLNSVLLRRPGRGRGVRSSKGHSMLHVTQITDKTLWSR